MIVLGHICHGKHVPQTVGTAQFKHSVCITPKYILQTVCNWNLCICVKEMGNEKPNKTVRLEEAKCECETVMAAIAACCLLEL